MCNEAFEGGPEAPEVFIRDRTTGILDKQRKDIADVIDGPRREDESWHVLAIEDLADARERFIGRHTFSTVQLGSCLIDQGFRPLEVVLDRGHKIGNCHSHGLLQRSEMPSFDLGFQPSLLFGRKLDCHGGTLPQSE